MIRFLLFILRPFRLLFYKSGVDFDKMITIIRTKLTIDNRTSKNINSNKTKQINSALLQQGFSMLVMGTFALLMTWSKSGLTTAILLYHSMILVMLILSLLSEYTQMLFDSRDTHILLRLPVDSRTISTAKLITIGYYMLFLSFCSALIPTLVFIFTKGVATGLLLLSATLLNTLFALLLTNLVYMGCMRFASGENFRNILSYIQILMIVLVVCSYQLVANIPDNLILELTASDPWWFYLLPPVWFTALTELFLAPSATVYLYAAIGIVLPFISAYVTIKWFAPYFAAHLNPANEAPVKTARAGKEKTARFLAALFTRSAMQKSGFMLSWRLAAGNRKYKEAILPSIAYIIVLIGLQIFSIWKKGDFNVSDFMGFFPLYLTLLIGYTIIDNMKYNELGDYFWLYRTKPLYRPGSILLGAFKALYLKYFVPTFLLVSIPLIYIGGIAILPDILFIFTAITITTLVATLGISPAFPFSRERSTYNSGKVLVFILITMLVTAVFSAIHMGLRYIPYGIPAGILLLWSVLFLIAHKISRTSWTRLEKIAG